VQEQESEATEDARIEEKQQNVDPTVPPPHWPKPEEAWNLAPKELGNWLDLATQEAVRTPSEENVLRWVQYMDIARRKAMQFSSTWAWVMQKNPQYANASFPMTVPGRRAYNRARFHEVRKVLHENSKRFALLLFIDNGPFTSEAKRLAGMFMQDARWPVKIVDITKTPEIAALLGVRFTPQMWIIEKDNPKPVPVAAGLVSMKQLEMRVYRAVRIITGESEPQEYGVHEFERISFVPLTELKMTDIKK
jgi:conjugal transfer pilus assembly protein TraF